MRFKITYYTKATNKFHEPTYNVNSALELFDRYLRLRSKEIIGLTIEAKVSAKGERGGWWVVLGHWEWMDKDRLVDESRLDDKEYMEEMIQATYERALEYRKRHS